MSVRACMLSLLLPLAMSPASSLRAAPSAVEASIAEAQARDAEEAATVATNGRLLYAADADKRSWGGYCADARRLADLGELRLAIRQASKALFLGEEQGSNNARAFAMRDLAYAYAFSGRLDLAQGWAKQAIEAAARVGGSVDAANEIVAPSHKVLGDVAARRGQHEDALREYQAALSAASFFSKQKAEFRIAIAAAELRRGEAAKALPLFAAELGASDGLGAIARRGMGEASLALGKHAEARGTMAKALEESRRAKDAYAELWAHYGLARAALAVGAAAEADEQLDAALQVAETLRGAFHAVEFKSGFFGEVQDVFDFAIDQAARKGQIARALALSERSRARAALDMLRERTKPPRADAVMAAYSPEDARKALPAKTVFVAYHVLPESTLAWVVRAGGIDMKRLAWGGPRLQAEIARLDRDIVAMSTVARDELRALHETMIAPLGLAPGETVVVIPHQALHLAPLHAAGPAGEPLIKSNAVAYALSLSAAVESLRRPLASAGPLLALGNPDLGDPSLDLPAAEEEVKAIARIANAPAPFVRAEASAARFRAASPGAGIVHVAAHASVDEVDPIRSVLRLSGGDVEARDVYEIDLRGANLVALSACSSGVGRVVRGDEFWGFKRSFLVAGARSLLVSLWPVADDTTAELMTAFYRQRELMGGAEAMRRAQLEAMRLHPQPLFWAPFVVVGDWR